ncbi:MAG TPA: hypothetical protein VGD66_02765 [Allosphingosinicella sp.]
MRLIAAAFLAASLSGCIASTAVDIVTLPVKAASRTVDVLTTSQSEADEKRGRRLREHEECLGKEQRRGAKAQREPDYSRCPEARTR